jgi:hypothetical protein
MAYSGKFKPKNPKKYRGDSSAITYRSSWELRCMSHFDKTENVIWWSSEECIVPYRDPVSGKARRYFPDFVICVKQRDNTLKTIMIEIKPEYQKVGPTPQSKKTKRYITEVYKYAVNQAKWKAAVNYCADRRWDFQVMTEKTLGF